MALEPQTQQEETAKILAELLAQSILDENLKQVILDNIDKLTQEHITNLTKVLETENDQLEKVATEVEKFITNQEAGWEEVEKEQKNYADIFSEKMAQALIENAEE